MRSVIALTAICTFLLIEVVDSFHPHHFPQELLHETIKYSRLVDPSRRSVSTILPIIRSTAADDMDFGFQATIQKDIIVCQVTEPTVEELQLRKNDEAMFTASVRRDLYNILRNPYQPHQGAPAPLTWWGNNEESDDANFSLFGAILLAKKSVTSTIQADYKRDWDAYAFSDRLSFNGGSSSSSMQQSEWQEYEILDDRQMLDAIARMGKENADSIALTRAFEVWLEQIATDWGDLEVSILSVDFLIAFGNELTDRLGVNHRIQSSALSDDELKVLSEPPFVNYVRPELLQQFQLSKIEVDEKRAETAAEKLWWDNEDLE
eukprot:scaffold4004_cov105-Cylindrotheca_fusiformis.AAC.13